MRKGYKFFITIVIYSIITAFLPLFYANTSLAQNQRIDIPSEIESGNIDHKQGKVILIIMDRIGWTDIYDADTPNLDKLIDMGGIGLMTTNTGGVLNQNNAYLTLGTGAKVTGVSGSQVAISYDYKYQGERIQNLMDQISGYKMDKGSVANPSIAKLHRSNGNRPYIVNVGALGKVLRESGFKTAVFGNCDNYRGREDDGGGKNFLVSMMMDDRGIVPLGDVSQSILIDDPHWPMGIRTDYEKMLDEFKRTLGKAHVIAMQLGDTSRAEDFRHQIMDFRIEHYKKTAVEEGDKFIGEILNYFDPQRDYMMILTPVGPAKEVGNNNRLTPIIMAGKGLQKGWLTSGSTHRRGIVTNLDVGASILSHFGQKTLAGQGGAPIYAHYNPGGVEGLISFNRELVNIYNQRPFLLRGYVYTLTPILILAAILLLFKREYLNWVKPMLVFIMTIPLVYLLLPLLQQYQLYRTVIIAVAMAVTTTILLCRVFKNTVDRIMLTSSLTVMALLLDQWLGMKLIQASPLGYDVMVAARFYGMGNEYMGVLVGAACTAGASIIERMTMAGRGKLWAKAMFCLGLIILYTMVSPKLGANVGGTIALFAALPITFLAIREKKIGIGNVVAMGAFVVILLVGVFFLDSLRVIDSQSHMGQTANAIRENGLNELVNIFYRKISMNIRLFKTTMWTRVFLTSLVVMVLLLYRPIGIFMDVYKKRKILIKGLTGAIAGSIIALLFNDSGIVSAATAMIFVAPPFILLVVEEVQRRMETE